MDLPLEAYRLVKGQSEWEHIFSVIPEAQYLFSACNNLMIFLSKKLEVFSLFNVLETN